MHLQTENRALQEELGALKQERQSLEQKVVMLRAETIDPDYLVERARFMLGYVRPDEMIIPE